MEIALIVGALPSIIWLSFFLRQDIHPEPRWMIARVFLFGGAMTIAAMFIQVFAQGFLASFGIGAYSVLTLLLFAAIEEILKFSAAYFSVIKSRLFDERVDAMIYTITSAMGFAMMENIAVIWNSPSASYTIEVTILRFIGATLLHALASGIAGYYLARALSFRAGVGAEPSVSRVPYYTMIASGLVYATLLHGIFNSLIIVGGGAVVFPLLFLIASALLVFRDFETLKRV